MLLWADGDFESPAFFGVIADLISSSYPMYIEALGFHCYLSRDLELLLCWVR